MINKKISDLKVGDKLAYKGFGGYMLVDIVRETKTRFILSNDCAVYKKCLSIVGYKPKPWGLSYVEIPNEDILNTIKKCRLIRNIMSVEFNKLSIEKMESIMKIINTQ